MNLTAEQICDLKQEICEDNGWMRDAIPRFHAICDMAKRTLAAEKDAERLDFLDRNLSKKFGWKVSIAPAGNISITSVIQLGSHNAPKPIREAIDDALRSRS